MSLHWFVRLAAVGGAIAFAGCGIHPLPEDVSGVTTFDIVERIRCEAQEGLRSLDDAESWRIAGATTISMSFDFNISSGAGGGVTHLDFDKVSPSRHFKLDTTSDSTFERENRRRFNTTDRLLDVDDYECSGKLTRPNLAYPITGTIGLDEVVRTYVQIEKQTNLAKKSDTIFSDALTFTTEFDLGLNSTWKIDAVVGAIKLTKLSLAANVHRSDIHTVKIAIAREPVGPAGSGLAKFERNALKALIKNENIRDPRSQLALVQKDSDARTRTLLELERLRILNDDDRVAARVLGQRMLDILKVP